MSSPSTAVCKRLASTAQQRGPSRGLRVGRQDRALGGLVLGRPSPAGWGMRQVARVAGTGTGPGRGGLPQQLCRGRPDAPESLEQHVSRLPRRLTGYQRAAGAAGERREIKRDLKGK